MMFHEITWQQYSRTECRQRRQDGRSWGHGYGVGVLQKAGEQFSWGPRFTQGPGKNRTRRSQTWAGRRECPREPSVASLIQARIQILVAFPDGLGEE